MRILIAAGGTGGHIYPALAVAASLRARADRHDAPDLRWLGGHRGLEAQLVPAAGIPLRRLPAAPLRATRPDMDPPPRPGPPRPPPPPGGAPFPPAQPGGGFS